VALGAGSTRFDSEITVRNATGARQIIALRVSADPRCPRPLARVMAAFSDITAQKRNEQDRLAMELRLRQQQKLEAIGAMVGGVAHEINDPVNGIANYAQLLKDRLPPDSPLHEYLSGIETEAGRVATVVRSLLAFARTDTNHRSPACVSDLVSGALALVGAVMRRDQIAMAVGPMDSLPMVCCRSQQVRQVLLTLLTNAREALNQHYPAYDPLKQVSLTATTFHQGTAPWLRLTVADGGTPIPDDLRPGLFDPLRSGTACGRGSGLGLAICRSIAREHGGDLLVETEAGPLTRFHLDLPAMGTESTQEGGPAATSQSPAAADRTPG